MEKIIRGVQKKINAAIHELSDNFCYEIGILRSEISELRNSTTPSETSDESSLQMEKLYKTKIRV